MRNLMHGVLAFCLALAVMAGAAFVYFELRYFGFPDGHVTALERALKPLGSVFIAASIAFAVWFGYLGWIAARGKLHIAKKLWISALAYAVVLLTLLAIRVYLGQHFAHGGGG